MTKSKNDMAIILIGVAFFLGCQSRVHQEEVGLFVFPVRYDINVDSSKTRFDSFYFLGTQKTEQALPFIMNFIDTMRLDTSVAVQRIAFMRYEEGLPMNDRYNEEWAYKGHAESFMFFEMDVDNQSRSLAFRYRDGIKILAQGLITLDEIRSKGRRKSIQTLINSKIKY
jgi:hypothetical protein